MRYLLRLCGVAAPALALCLALSSTSAFSSPAAPALAGIVVNSTSDAAANDGLCTLREAITSANSEAASGAASGECAAGSGTDTITFSVTGTIDLTGALPDIASDMSVNGPGSSQLTVRRGTGGDYRVLTVASGVTADISGLTLTGGHASSPLSGGGLSNSGTLSLTGVAVSGNTAAFGGGGIVNDGTLTLYQTTVSGNRLTGSGPGVGGGILHNGGGPLNVSNSTVSGNDAGNGSGGGIAAFGGAVRVTNSTVSGNLSGGITNYGGATVTLTGSIVANTLSASGNADLSGAFLSRGFNLVEAPGTATINETENPGTNIYAQDPRLGALMDNGGPTQTHALLPGSPATDKGRNFATDPAGNPVAIDQRGSARPFDQPDIADAAGGDGSDIGAYEVSGLTQTGTNFVVNVTGDRDGYCTTSECSLRQAINAANAQAGADTITFSVSGTINLARALPNLSTDMTITGPGAPLLTVRRHAVEGTLNFRILTITNGASPSVVTISGLTVSEGIEVSGGGILNFGALTLNACVVSGNWTTNGSSGSPGGDGGGIYNYSTGVLTLIDTTVTGNTTGDGGATNELNPNPRGGNGGGIYNTGTLRVMSSTISNNTTGKAGAVNTGGGNGGGISNATGATLTMVNSTVTGNVTGNGGSANAGGFGGGVSNIGSATLTNCTVVNNRTGGGMAGGFGGGIASIGFPGATSLGNTIVANNTVSPAGSGPDIHSEVNSRDYNLIRNTSGATINGSTANNIYGQDPRLGPLADNGGPTQTHALLAGSPALDAGSNALALDASNNPLTTDQRGAGFPRIADAADADATQTVDIGAFEAHPSVEDISNKATNEDTPLSFSFNVGDAAHGISSVTASSSNAALLPNDPAHISVTGSGSTRTLQLTPAANHSGLATITVTVTATNGQSASDTFQVTVTAVNDAPTLDALGDLTINEDAVTQTVNLSSISAGPFEFQGLTVTATSSDTTLIPDPSVNYTSSAATGSISFAPAANRSGTATITVTVTDNGGTANGGVNTFSRTFNVTVNAVNDAPVNTVPGSQPTVQHTPVVFSAANSNAISVADVDAGTDAVKVTLTGTTGTVTLGSTAGLTFVTGDGTDDPVSSFTGTLSAINAALNGLSFKPAQGFGGAAGLQIVTDDLGHNGSGGALSDTDGVTIDVAPGGTFQFIASAFEVNEDGTSATITVIRGGGSAGAASVNYATTDVTATGGATCAAGVDYISASGTFSWADGENAAKTFTVTLCEDFDDTGDETVRLSLSGATGSATVFSHGTATLTIKDYNPSGGALQFSQNGYSVAEGVVALTVTVLRSGHAATGVTVDYATDDGSTPAAFVPCSSTTGLALDRCDYTRALGTLSFAAGEREKTFQVLISDDSYAEGSETAQLKLSNPTGGAQLGKRAAAVMTITDDSPESAGNPIDDATEFVTQHYHDFLNRDPDAEGLAFWVGGIESCGADAGCREVKRIDTSAAFFLSIEFQNTGYLVERTYKTAFGDATSPGVPGTVPIVRLDEFLRDTQRIGRDVIVNQGDWEARLAANKGAYALEFIQRQRFQAAFPASMTAAEFVGKLDENAGGVLSADERAQLTALLAPDPPDPSRRAAVLRQVAEDQTLVERERNRAFVLMQYFGYLRRNPDDAPEQNLNFGGWKFWLGKLEEFGGDYRRAEMVKAFLSSIEYRQRFGQ